MAIRVATCIALSLILTGCTVPVKFYLRNTSMDEVKIKAHLMNEASLGGITYRDEIIQVSHNLNEDLTKILRPVKREGEYLYYILPPLSTLFIGEGANFRNFTFDEIEISKKDGDKTILNWENQGLLQKGKSFPNRHFAWYDIKQ